MHLDLIVFLVGMLMIAGLILLCDWKEQTEDDGAVNTNYPFESEAPR